jgi:NhaP-type Na+/H+ or K+/H+ antiporter
VLLVRPIVYLAAFAPTRVEWNARLLVAWFGPRGLSSLLLALLPVFAGAGEGAEIFRVACLVVLCSIVAHGGTLIWLGRRDAPAPPARAPATGRADLAPIAVPPSTAGTASPELITVDELRALLAVGAPVLPVDVRKVDARAESSVQAQGSVRLSPDTAAGDARILGLPADAWLVLYCT